MILKKLNKPNVIFAEVVEDGAIDQFQSAMECDFTVRGALMPDVHKGYSLPIGGVVETKGVVVPSWVGYDIGCGMLAVKTTFKKDDIYSKRFIIHDVVYDVIPVGFNKRSVSPVQAGNVNDLLKNTTKAMKSIYHEKQGALQLGTLGGGNHFIEIGYDRFDRIWIIIHSGSRGVGHGCASHYMKLASPNGKASEGHFGFDVLSQNGQDYIKDMNFCLDFALWNRKVMLWNIIEAIHGIGVDGRVGTFISPHGDMINRNHNHAESKDGIHWIHRKGATHAERGMFGVIPGNMRDGSFIVRGLGNDESLCSSSHGAGRVLGRRAAKETLNVDDFKDTMEGVVASVDFDHLDESPFAYKDIFDVMRLQEGLVETIAHIKPIINWKG